MKLTILFGSPRRNGNTAGLGCVQEDDFQSLFGSMADCNVLVLATPIYGWYCTAPP